MSTADFPEQLAAADRQHPSWRQKLAWLNELLRDESLDASDETFVYIAVYLRFLASGEIPCEEDGGHHRPSHHARLSQEIHQALAARTTAENRGIVRRIYPYLPSFDEAFTRREPLTRIRDIAHRNDIPQELKREIKTRLQNKLHRCAAPSDLQTSAELLARITNPPASYPAPFVEQFRIFHGELQEFFGARALSNRLDELARSAEGELAAEAARYRDKKASLADAEEREERRSDPSQRAAEQLIELLAQGVRLRRLLAKRQASDDERARRCRLADIGLADHAFVLAGQFRACIEGGEPEQYLPLALAFLEQLLVHLELDGWQPARTLTRELSSWGGRFEVNNRDHLLRLKAFGDRIAQRVQEHADGELARFVRPAERLGRALGVSEAAITAFSEGALRGGLPFQLSVINEYIARQVRVAAKLSPWIALYVGVARGRLRRVHTLAELGDLAESEPTVALVEQASGDETVPPAVVGVILAHEIPQLSHLGVRVRQSNVVFACCDAPAALAVITQHEGRWVELSVSARNAQVLPAAEPLSAQPLRQITSKELALRPRRVAGPVAAGERVLRLTEQAVGAELVGHKAATVGQLFRLSRIGEGFAVPRALVIPFSVLDTQLEQRPKLARQLESAAQAMDSARDDATRTVIRVQVRGALAGLEVPAELRHGCVEVFGTEARLMVRSSACLEDRAGAAGAGVYESVANVSGEGLDLAVRQVWASLWNERAVAMRHQAGVTHERAQMAVLVQEMITPDLSFIMHTVNPISGRPDEATVELAVGHGEVLASARVRGTPFRLVCNKNSGHVVTEAFASFDRGLWPAEDGGLEERPIDYSEVPLMANSAARRQLGQRLGEVAQLVERELGGPQDVEGLVSGDTIYLVQSRPQQGLDSAAIEHNRRAESRPVPKALFPIFGLFERQIEGDDALFALAQRRFRTIGMGAEFHGGDPERLEELWRFSPQERAMIHLPRGLDLLDPKVTALVVSFAGRFAGRLNGIVIHDQWAMVERAAAYREAVETISGRLSRIDRAPRLFVEFAVGLQPEEYIGFFESVRGLPNLGACLDIGHVGIWYARRHFAGLHEGEDICALTPYDPKLPAVIEDVEAAVRAAIDRILEMIRQLGAWQTPTHFHLHDGHPLWTLSPYRACDHMSFLEEISLPFTHEGRRSVSPLYGPSGLAEIICAALSLIGIDKLSATLEIHPLPGQQRLCPEDAALFGHWREKANAERMNYWLSVLQANFELLQEIIADSGYGWAQS